MHVSKTCEIYNLTLRTKQNPLRRTECSSNHHFFIFYLFIYLLIYLFIYLWVLQHPVFNPPLISQHCLTSRTQCRAIGFHVFLTQPLTREAEDFPRGMYFGCTLSRCLQFIKYQKNRKQKSSTLAKINYTSFS